VNNGRLKTLCEPAQAAAQLALAPVRAALIVPSAALLQFGQKNFTYPVCLRMLKCFSKVLHLTFSLLRSSPPRPENSRKPPSKSGEQGWHLRRGARKNKFIEAAAGSL
jgi:hypothetical protein